MTDIETTQQAPTAPEKVGRSKVVLHIGTHKTATTTIQDTFWENADLLARHGMIYPKYDKHTGHHGLVYDWANLPQTYALPGGSRAALAQLAQDHAHKPVTVFLSSEEFSRGDPKGATDFEEVRDLLSAFDEIEVICTLRPQWQFIQSIYLELSKHRNPARPPHLIKAALETGLVAGLWVDYNLLLTNLEKTFAPSEITLLDFDTVRAAPGGVLGTMMRHVGLEIGADDLVAVNGGASNVSPRPVTGWTCNVLSEPHVAPRWLLDLVDEAVDLEFPDKQQSCLFTREELRRLEAHFTPLNEALQTRRRDVQPDFALSVPDRGKLEVFRNAIPASLWVRIGRRQTAQMIRAGLS